VAISELKDPAHWRDKADEARTEAEDEADPELRKMMEQVAAEYDQLDFEIYLIAKGQLLH
jgi:hypothetical protein